MSAAAELEPFIPENVVSTEVTVIPTEETLEWGYGHLSPDELLEANLTDRLKARVAQLQITALYLVAHTPGEATEWLACYQKLTHQIPKHAEPDPTVDRYI